MNATHGAGALAALVLVFGLVGATPAESQTHFIDQIAPSGAPVFQFLATFDSPAGTGTSRLTFIKLVTDNPTPEFQIQRAPGVTAQVEPDAPQDSDDSIVEGLAATQVAAVLAVTAGSGAPFCAATTVAAGQAICIIVLYDDAYGFTAGPETWQLNVLEDASTQFEYFGWVGTVEVELSPFATAESAVTREKIEASSPVYFGGVQRDVNTNFAPVLAPAVRNVGTAPLTITGGPISNDPSPGFFSTRVFTPAPMDPGAALASNFGANQGIWVMASPSELGNRQSTLTLQSASGSESVTLDATGVTLYSHFLVDCSGSMGWKPDGNETSVENETRLFQLKQGGQEINNWIRDFSDGQAYVGFSTFPDCGDTPAPAGDVIVPINRSVNNHPSINLQLSPETGGGLKTVFQGTPMESGIEVAVGDMDARIANPGAEPNASDRPLLRQTILLFSDGEENQGSNAQSEIPGLANDDVRVYTVGYGIPGWSNVNHELLKSLASGTTGEFFDANSLDPFALKDAFKNAVRTWLGLQPNVDPVETIRAGQRRSHTVCLDPDAYGATFVVDWDRPAAGGVSLTLQSPSGETITPSSAGVAFYSDQTFAQYNLRGDRIRGGAGAGAWTLNVTGGQSIPANQTTRYSYSVLSQTPIEVEPVRKWDIFTAGAYLLEVRLTGWRPEYLREATVTVNYDAPAQSFGTYLATTEIDPAWVFTPQQLGSRAGPPVLLGGLLPMSTEQQDTTQIRRAPDSIMGEPASIAQRKVWALANIAGNPFGNERSTGTLQMYDNGTNGDLVAGDGIYSAQMSPLQFEGIYNYAFEVATPGLSGVCINRDLRLTDLVAVHLSSDLIVDNLAWEAVEAELFFDPVVAREMAGAEVEPGFVRTAAVLTPRDELGNYWGPGRADDIEFEVRDGTPVGGVIDNWNDGEYILVVEHRQDTRPTVVVTAAGVTSAPITQPGGLPPWLWILIIVILIALVIVIIRKL